MTTKKKKPASRKALASKTTGRTHRDTADNVFAFRSFEPNNATKMMENAMTQGKSQFDKFAHEANKASTEQFEALMKAGNITMKNCEDFAKTWMSWAQSSAEKNSQAVKSFLGCKTLNELAEAQNKLAQQNFDDLMQGAVKFSELAVKLSSEAIEPINAHWSKLSRKASQAAA